MIFFGLADSDGPRWQGQFQEAVQENAGEVNIIVGNANFQGLDFRVGSSRTSRQVEVLRAFFGPCPDTDVFLIVPPGTLWAHVLAAVGAFSSIGAARKNGWNKPIEAGFTFPFKVGKKNRKFFASLNLEEALKFDEQEAE